MATLGLVVKCGYGLTSAQFSVVPVCGWECGLGKSVRSRTSGRGKRDRTASGCVQLIYTAGNLSLARALNCGYRLRSIDAAARPPVEAGEEDVIVTADVG